MKKKTQIKKLQISRETLRLLTTDQLVRVAGGIEWTGCMSECTECGGPGGGYQVDKIIG